MGLREKEMPRDDTILPIFWYSIEKMPLGRTLGSEPSVVEATRRIVELYLNAEFPQKRVVLPIAEIALSEINGLLECGLPKNKRPKSSAFDDREALETVTTFVGLVRRVLASKDVPNGMGKLLATIRVRVQIASTPLNAAFTAALLQIARLEAVSAIPSKTEERFSQMREDFSGSERDGWKPSRKTEERTTWKLRTNVQSVNLEYWKSLLDEEIPAPNGGVFVLRHVLETVFRKESGDFWENFREAMIPFNAALSAVKRPTLSIQNQGTCFQLTGVPGSIRQSKILESLGLSFPGVLVGVDRVIAMRLRRSA